MSLDNIPEHFRRRIKKAKEKQLEILDLSSDWNAEDSKKLTKIPDEVFELTHLTTLYLSNNKLTNLPESISKFSNLEELNLNYNKLTNLPESIGKFSNLEELSLSSNKLINLPESIGELSNLIKLDLNSNQLTTLPESIGELSNLIKLDLSSNQLTTLPESIGKLADLIKLNLRENKLTILPESIGKLSDLIKLDLRENKLTILPKYIGELSSLIELDVSSNQLTTLPKYIGELSSLIELNLSSNQLATLPESIGELSNLINLNLNENRLTNLPESCSNFSNLTTLNLRRNKLINLPENIGELPSLIELNLNDNQLTTLPESLGNTFSLKNLYLSNNQLSNLPEYFSNLSNLTKLNLSDNRLNKLPKSLGNLSKLRELYLSNNPLETPPLEVASKGIGAIREYFRQLREEGTDYIYEAKLLIVGEAGAGKTTLAKKIEDSRYQLRHDEETTKGIDVIKWSFPLDNEREFKVNIWDFGGQEIYHATHQFFLTKRSLYALVADTRKEDTDFHYWLNIIELLSNNSPLLIVKNEKGDRYIDIDENSLRGRFENLKESLATNLKDNRGLNNILKSFQYHFTKLPHIGSALPKTWKRVREALEQDQRNYISLEEYLKICQDNGFTQLKDKLQLSDYLHDLGVCLHFQDSPLLKNTVILKPKWGTDAVYKVLDDKQVINNLGRFTTEDLDKIWSDEQYCFKQAELLELMMRFKLCYQIPGTNDTYIAPQLLTKTKPTYDWDESNNLILRYTYEFMPKGIITQLIVVMHQYIYQQKYVWRSGVILNKEETLAEVIEYYDKRELKIRVSGKFTKDLLTILSHELHKIHSSYPRLKYQKLIPCNCQQCKSRLEPYFYDFDRLKQFLADRQATIQCQLSYRMIDVRNLIDDVIGWNDQNRREEAQSHLNQSLVSVTINNPNQQQGSNNNMSNINQHGKGDNIAGDKVIGDKIGTQINNAQNLTQAANEIKELLNQLSVDYPDQTPVAHMMLSAKVVEKIENNPSLKQKVTNALKEAGTTALESAIDHPAAKVLIAGVKGYIDA